MIVMADKYEGKRPSVNAEQRGFRTDERRRIPSWQSFDFCHPLQLGKWTPADPLIRFAKSDRASSIEKLI